MKTINSNEEPSADKTQDEAQTPGPVKPPLPGPKDAADKPGKEKKTAAKDHPRLQQNAQTPGLEKKAGPAVNVHLPRPAPTPMPFRERPDADASPRPATPAEADHATAPDLATARVEEENGKTGVRGINPGLRLRAIETAARGTKKAKLPLWRRIARRPDPTQTRRAYFYVTGTISLIINLVLIAALLILARYTIWLKDQIVNDVLYEGLYVNFGEMDQAHIRTEIPIDTLVHASIPVTINQNTDVVLTSNVTIIGARVTLTTGGLNIVSAPTNIVLPAGTVLPVQLNLTVPVEADIPVSMIVPVDIPLNQTELHGPFVGLQDAVAPYVNTFYTGAAGPQQVPFCKLFSSLCEWWFLP